MTILNLEETTLEAGVAALKDGYVVIKAKGIVVALVEPFKEERLKNTRRHSVRKVEVASIADCAKATKRGYVVITRNDEPFAMISEFDQEQFELGTSDKFWRMVQEWRKPGQKYYSQEEVDRMFGFDKPARKKSKKATTTKAKKAVVK